MPKGKGTDGVTDIQYRLELFGTFADPSNWPPATGSSNRLFISGWRVTTEGKGLAKDGCTGTGTFGATTIFVERLK